MYWNQFSTIQNKDGNMQTQYICDISNDNKII